MRTCWFVSVQFEHTEHIEGHSGLSEVNVVFTGGYLTAIFPRVFLGDWVYRQRRSLNLSPSCVGLWDGKQRNLVLGWKTGGKSVTTCIKVGWINKYELLRCVSHLQISCQNKQKSLLFLSFSTQLEGSDLFLSWTHRTTQRLKGQKEK